MKKILEKLAPVGVGIGIAILIMVAVYALSWIVTVGIIKLITLCFGWTFSWVTATGIWLIILILKSIFSHNTTVKK